MGQRPAHLPVYLGPPAYLSPSPPVPQADAAPAAQDVAPPAGEAPDRLEPTRYGDWEQKGIAVDF
ncbi:MAG: DUF1674 domain-containing protein [Sphingobium sp.]|nr:DUF1674 domain-containing protein [Sphingobium sp.]